MAINGNPLLQGLSGHIGKQLVYKKYEAVSVVSKYPNMSNRKLSPKQLQNNKVMEKANAEAKKILADEGLRSLALVRLNVASNKLYHALIREYFDRARSGE